MGPIGPCGPATPIGPIGPCGPAEPERPEDEPIHTPLAAITAVFPTVKPFLTTKVFADAKVHSPLRFFLFE